MGTDIHGGFFVKDEQGVREVIPNEEWDHRNYKLFAALAGVRNGYGFAGVKTHTPLTPIAEDRGIPEWFKPSDYKNEWYDPKWCDPEEEYGYDLGEHSQTYMTLREILDYDWNQKLGQLGYLDRDHYEETFAIGKPPQEWSGGVFGKNVVTDTPETITEATTHVQCAWGVQLIDSVEWFIDIVNSIVEDGNDPDNTYMIIGFDS